MKHGGIYGERNSAKEITNHLLLVKRLKEANKTATDITFNYETIDTITVGVLKDIIHRLTNNFLNCTCKDCPYDECCLSLPNREYIEELKKFNMTNECTVKYNLLGNVAASLRQEIQCNLEKRYRELSKVMILNTTRIS